MEGLIKFLKIGKRMIFFLLLVLCLVGYGKLGEEKLMQKQIASKVLRFHVLANSDEPLDQEIKLKVRDAIGGYLEPKLKEADDLKETKRIIEANLENIVSVAEQVLEQQGKDYGAAAYLTEADFPVKRYGCFRFPAGTYQALRVTLGRGEGHNWWCVLYPNMCFQGSMYEVVDKEAGQRLREVLDPEEYEQVLEAGNYRIHFKLWEIVENHIKLK